MLQKYPDPGQKHPLPNFDRVCFIKNTVRNPNIVIGDFTYYDDPECSEEFEKNVLYHYDFIGDRLLIGKFCAIGTSVKFIMNGANHRMDTFSTFPFAIFGSSWTDQLEGIPLGAPPKGDTFIGNDVWLGYDTLVMPGAQIGNGAIVAAKSVVTGTIEPYSIYGGNPAKLIRYRFDPETIAFLEAIEWWNWDYSEITKHLKAIFSADRKALSRAFQDVQAASK